VATRIYREWGIYSPSNRGSLGGRRTNEKDRAAQPAELQRLVKRKALKEDLSREQAVVEILRERL
jgi:hypothetical protein